MWTAKMARQCGTGRLWDSSAVERGLADLTWGAGYDVDTIKRAHVGPLFPFEEATSLKGGDLVFAFDGDPCRVVVRPEPDGESQFWIERLKTGTVEPFPRTESEIIGNFNPWPGFVNELAAREPQYLA